jgi:hypothetical protein
MRSTAGSTPIRSDSAPVICAGPISLINFGEDEKIEVPQSELHCVTRVDRCKLKCAAHPTSSARSAIQPGASRIWLVRAQGDHH